jgi:glycosyltransferase involved in cell wall biosynthesis
VLTVAVMPFYERPLVTGFAMQSAKRIRGVDRLIAVGSTGTDFTTAERSGVEYRGVANAPLGSKWQACIKAALEADADQILLLSSDDWWEPDLLKRLSPYSHEYAMVAPREWGLVDVSAREAYWMKYRYRWDGIGTGRLFNARFIRDHLGGVLYTADAPRRGMDWFATKRIEEHGGSVLAVKKALVVELKGCSGKQQIYHLGELLGSPLIWSEQVSSETPWAARVLREWGEWESKALQS